MRGGLGLMLAGVACVPLLAACGGNGAFPEPAECVTAAPLPTATPGLPQRGAYFSALRNGLDDLEAELDDFRLAWPSGNFSRQSEFRLDFAEYSDRTRCTATYMRDLTPPGAEFESFDQRLGTALDDLLTHTEFGREAVRRRNVSDWRVWRDGVDAKIDAVSAAFRTR